MTTLGKSREEHLAWCKQRAHDELNYNGSPADAVASMISDLGKHPETREALRFAGMLAMTVRDRKSAIAYPISRWLIGKTLRISPRSRPMVRLFSGREARKRIRKMRKA